MKKVLILITCLFIAAFLIYFKFAANQMEEQKPNFNYKSWYQDPPMNLIVLKLAHGLPISDPQHLAIIERFISIVESGSDWKIRVELYPDNSLGTDDLLVQGVKNGTVEMCLVGGNTLSKLVPRMKIFEIPYLFNDYEGIQATLKGDLGLKVSKDLNTMGVRTLAWSLNGFRQVSIDTEKTEGNRGRDKWKMATIYSDVNKLALDSMGLESFPVDTDKTMMALNQELVDGHDHPPVLSYFKGWYDNTKEIWVTKHSISPSAYLINVKFWDSLSKENQQLIEKAAQLTAEYEIELLKKMEDDVFDSLKRKGIKFRYPDLDLYKKNVKTKVENWIKNNPELENEYKDILNKK